MLIFHDPATLTHRTVEFLGAKLQNALECPERLESILRAVGTSKHEIRVVGVDKDKSKAILDELSPLLSSTHDAGYLEHLATVHDRWVSANLITQDQHVLPECFLVPARSASLKGPPKDIFARSGYYSFDMSSGVMSETYNAAIASANLALQGAQALKHGRASLTSSQPILQTTDSVLALCRPPGHHCDTRRSGGYCYINNAVIAVQSLATDVPHVRIGILDIDFHHGNGTQEFFYENPDVMYVSIHGEDEFPYYTGSADEKGAGSGFGFNVNYPLPTGSSLEAYLEQLDEGLVCLKNYQPDYLLISLGFDTFQLDPLGNFKIDTEDYGRIAGRIHGCLKYVPTLILLEGGYVIDRLGENVLAFLEGWEST